MEVTFFWKCAAKIAKDYTVFLHLLDSNGRLRAQTDAQPLVGAYPTTLWDVDETIRDHYVLAFPRDLEPGDYQIEVGLYEYPSLARLSVTDKNKSALGNHLVLDQIVQVPR